MTTEVREETKIIKNTVYKALDGTEFNNESDCIEYEHSAKCAVRAHYHFYVIGETNEWDLLRGDEYHSIDIVSIPDDTAITIVTQMIAYVQKSDPDPKTIELIKEAKGENLFICWNTDQDWCWVLGTVKSLTDTMNKIVNEAVNKEN